jgi:diguanylate cyclase (GGDEF)-like protein
MSSAPPEHHALVDLEISRLEGGAVRWLHFAHTLEDLFEEKTAKFRASRMSFEGLICLLLYNSFLFCDYLVARQHFMHFLFVRLCFATPVGALVVLGVRRSRTQRSRELLILLACAICSVTTLYLYLNISAVASAYALTDLMLIVLFTNAGIRLRLRYSIAATSLCITFGTLFLNMDHCLSAPEKIESFTVLTAGAVLSLLANYSIERGERLNFLLRLRSEDQTMKLEMANQHLLQISNQDRLTGISNRRHFEETYQLLWNQCIARHCAISVIMIDIDEFKLLNDRYGHSYGDAVLRRVATLLGDALRNQGDFVARFGGEEFVVVLPNTPLEAARIVADRMRVLIEIAGRPATDPDPYGVHRWSTVSCGVASTSPRKNMAREDVLAVADKELYRAKSEGRNRVCCAPEIAVPIEEVRKPFGSGIRAVFTKSGARRPVSSF